MTNDFPPAREAERKNRQAYKDANVHAGFGDKAALPLHGKLDRTSPTQLLHFTLDAGELKAKASAYGCTVTVFLTALILQACRENSTDNKDAKIQVQVPVNLRPLFGSRTLRNFSLYCSIRLKRQDIVGVGELVPEIQAQLAQGTSRAALAGTIEAAWLLVHLLRFVPLFLKKPVGSFLYGLMGDTVFTSTLSNLGLVRLPSGMETHVDKMDFILGPGLTNRALCGLITCNGKSVVSITKRTADTGFEISMEKLLREQGLIPEIERSPLYGA